MTTSRRSRQTSFVDGCEPVSLLPTPTSTDGERPRNSIRPMVATGKHGWDVASAVVDMTTGAGHRAWAGCSPPATPASPSATPGSGPARMTPGTSGRTFADCLPDFQPTSRIGCFSRTFVATSAWGSTVCSMTWTTSATPRGRSLYLLRVSARSTAGTGCGSSGREPILLPTPRASEVENDQMTVSPSHLKGTRGWNIAAAVVDIKSGNPQRMWPTPRAGKTTDKDEAAWTKRQERGDVSTPPLSLAVKMWPTPTVQDGKNTGGPSQWERNSDPLNVAVQRAQLWPTPMTSSAAINATTPSSQNRGRTNGPALAEAVSEHRPGQKLNPLFVSRLMGYPDGWLDLSDSDPA